MWIIWIDRFRRVTVGLASGGEARLMAFPESPVGPLLDLAKFERVDAAIDSISTKFGKNVIKKASLTDP